MPAHPDKVGRWTVTKVLPHKARRPNRTDTRARYAVRCVCGVESIAWYEDLTSGRTNGCRSLKCRLRHEVYEDLLRRQQRRGAMDPKARAMYAALELDIRAWFVDAMKDDLEVRRSRTRGDRAIQVMTEAEEAALDERDAKA